MKIQVIIGSTRPGRVSDRVAKWTEAELNKIEGVQVEMVDLLDYDLPFLNEPISPQYNPNRKPEGVVKQWLDKIAEADGYALVTPEYNRSYSAVLKNALDYLDFQMKNKPVALVAHGSTGGSQAVSHLRGVIPGVQAVTVPTATYLAGRAGEIISDIGTLDEEIAANPHGPAGAIENTVKSLVWYTEALAAARD